MQETAVKTSEEKAKGASSTPAASRGISPKYLVNMGVFSAIYFVVVFAGGMLGFGGPIVMFAGFALSIFINGTVIMLYLVKTPVFGALTVLGTIVGSLMVLTGHVWYIIPCAFALGLIGDIIVRAGKSRNRWLNILAYGIITVWYMIPLMPIVINGEEYFKSMEAQMGVEYVNSFREFFTSPWILYGWGAVAFLLGIIAGWLGTKILVKHFAKAGIV